MATVHRKLSKTQDTLVIVVSNGDKKTTSEVAKLLCALEEGGLLGFVGVCAAQELVDHKGDCSMASNVSDWQFNAKDTLKDILNKQKLSSMSVLSLRTDFMSEDAYATEHEALHTVKFLLPPSLLSSLRQLTVAPSLNSVVTERDLSADWDYHLVCDTWGHPTPDTPLISLKTLTSTEAYLQSMMTGITVVGGWADEESVLASTDLHQAGIMPIRFCHSSMRAIYAPHSDRIERSRFVPHGSPWPLPSGAGCEAAIPGSVPSWDVVNQMTSLMGIRCKQPPSESDALPRYKFKIWRRLRRPLAQSSEERSLQIFLARLGIEDSELLFDTMQSRQNSRDYCVQAMEEQGLEKVADDLEKSGFRLAGGSAEANNPTPEAWQCLYQLCFGLVDGGTLPDGIEHPATSNHGRLVWTETDGIVPEPFLAEDTSGRTVVGAKKLLAPQSPGRRNDDKAQNGKHSNISEEYPTSKSEYRNDEMLAGILQLGGEHDSLMLRLKQILSNALKEAREGFCGHAFVYDAQEERHAKALQAQRKARKSGWVAITLLAIVGVFTLDHRFGFVNETWRWVFDSNAPLRLYSPSTFPWVTLLLAATVTMFVCFSLLNSWRVFMTSAGHLEKANINRQHNNQLLLHYISELLRIRTLTRQFEDHMQVIARMLHRPFGQVVLPETIAAPHLHWLDSVYLPTGLLVASSAPSDTITDEDQRRLKKVFRANWLNELAYDMRLVWQKAYQDKIVSGFEPPENDTSIYGTSKHRNRQTGEIVTGSRSDWIDFVLGDEQSDMSSHAKIWLEKQIEEASRDSSMTHAAHLTKVKPHTEHVGWWENAEECLGSAVKNHNFDWESYLLDTAPTPALNATASKIAKSSTLDKSLMVLFAWELVITDPINSQHLKSWDVPIARTDIEDLGDII